MALLEPFLATQITDIPHLKGLFVGYPQFVKNNLKYSFHKLAKYKL